MSRDALEWVKEDRLTDGQRRYDLDILVENVAGGMVDLAMMPGRPPELYDRLVDEAASVPARYDALWDVLHDEPEFTFADRFQMQDKIRRLHELGFAVDEIALVPTGAGDERLRLTVAVAARRYHASELREITGLDVGEGQARVLLGDLRAYEATLREFHADRDRRRTPRRGQTLSRATTARLWHDKVFRPGMEQAHEALHGVGDPVQAYCDLLEVRWLLSEQAGRDVGNGAALRALAERAVPTDSAAMAAIAEESTQELPVLIPGGAGGAGGGAAGGPGGGAAGLAVRGPVLDLLAGAVSPAPAATAGRSPSGTPSRRPRRGRRRARPRPRPR